jgi:hypothetical protein
VQGVIGSGRDRLRCGGSAIFHDDGTTADEEDRTRTSCRTRDLPSVDRCAELIAATNISSAEVIWARREDLPGFTDA